jgi:two-component system, chemotaxis family, CheB/CheR fusion protein
MMASHRRGELPMVAKKRPTKRAIPPKRTKSPSRSTATANPVEESPPTPAEDHAEESAPGPPVVGIGASAGGLVAFEKFFAAMPINSGVAFVLIPHLDPDHESLMVELLTRYTKMPVTEATDGTAVEADHAYILPPNKYMTMSDGILRLTGPVGRGGPSTSIDLFLRSLASDKREKAIGIILSGTGAHGSLGLKAIKASDGMAMVQEPKTAEYPQMPESAIATGLADYVLPVEQMPEALIKYIQHDYVKGSKTSADATDAPDHLNQILSLLRARTKLDFRWYRQRMLVRRIDRRMSLRHFTQVADYLAFLREHPDEVKQLGRDLLISVTNFFRDPEAFQALETEVIVPLVRAKELDAPIRVWSAGCATGEEPYSLGIMLLEQLAAERKNCQLQVFATDVDDDALGVARQGTYPESIIADVSPERLGRFFTPVDHALFRIKKELREIVLIARQNLITDAPFSKLDLVVCRNVLIYLEPEVQRKVIALLHFSLNEGGFLFLGPSETIGQHIDLFEPVSKKWRIFRRIGLSRPGRVEIPIATAANPLFPARRITPTVATRPVSFADMTHRLLLDQFAPPTVLINRKYEILYSFGPADRYLAFPAGEPTHDLLMMAREGLRAKLRSAVHKALRENVPVTLALQVKRNGDFLPAIVTVRPVQEQRGADGLLLITFQESDPDGVPPQHPESVAEESVVRQLESELKATQDDLQTTAAAMESSNEELKASNEEIMSMNEELQSANEELETSKEELQSLNEELTTVNNQLQDKVAELESANNDIANLLNCTDVAIIFLDKQFRINRYTLPAKRLFNLIDTDVGRPLVDIAAKFSDATFQQDVERAFQTTTPIEKQVQTSDGCWWSRRIAHYRTRDHRIEGVVLTFSDVTQVRRGDEQARRMAAVLMDSNDAVTVHNFDGRISAWNRGAQHMLGYSEAEALYMNVDQMIPEEWQAKSHAQWERLRRGERVESWETQRRTKDGRILDVSVTATALKDESGRPVAIAKTKRDITEQKRAQDELRQSESRYRTLFNSMIEGFCIIEMVFDTRGRPVDYRFLEINSAFEKQTGLHDAQGRLMRDLAPDHEAHWFEIYGKIALTGVPARFVNEAKALNRWYEVSAFRFGGTESRKVAVLFNDISDSKRAEATLRDREARLAAILNSAADAIITIDVKGAVQSVNAAAEQMFGYAAAEMIGQNVKVLMPFPYQVEHNRYLENYLKTGVRKIIGIGREVVARRKDGSTFPVDLAVSEVEHMKLFTGILRDITRRKELEREVVEIASQEQRRIGQDLHDSVGQELTALNILAGDLAESSRANPSNGSKLVERIVEGLQRTQHELRAVLRGLLPVAVDSQGLMAALTDLAQRTEQEGKATCTFDCPKTVVVADNLTATHLYLIAQEAVRNAVKHAQPRNIRISLKSEDGLLELSVHDDGIGMPARPTDSEGGLGLRIMRNRATIIGATLTIQPSEPSGSLVKCVLARDNR